MGPGLSAETWAPKKRIVAKYYKQNYQNTENEKAKKKEKAKNVITKLSILFPNFLSPFINLSAVYVIKGSEVTFMNGS